MDWLIWIGAALWLLLAAYAVLHFFWEIANPLNRSPEEARKLAGFVGEMVNDNQVDEEARAEIMRAAENTLRRVALGQIPDNSEIARQAREIVTPQSPSRTTSRQIHSQ